MNNSSTIKSLIYNAKNNIFSTPEMYCRIINDFRNGIYFESLFGHPNSPKESCEMYVSIIEAYDLDNMVPEDHTIINPPDTYMWGLTESIISLYQRITTPQVAYNPPKFSSPERLVPENSIEDHIISTNSTLPTGQSLKLILDKFKQQGANQDENLLRFKLYMDLPVVNLFEVLANGKYARSSVFTPIRDTYIEYFKSRGKDINCLRIIDVLCELTCDAFLVKDSEELNFRLALICSILYDVIMYDKEYNNDEDYLSDYEILQIIEEQGL